MANVLVTGGVGYTGSHACIALAKAGHTPVSVDNLLTCWQGAVKFGAFVEGDLQDRAALDVASSEYAPVATIHFAALSQADEAMEEPGLSLRNNVTGLLNLVEAAVAAGCLDFVFSSTCATYGEHNNVVLDETIRQLPLNAYGVSKQAFEDILQDLEAAHGLRHVIFHYFNMAATDSEGEVGECHQPETHLILIMLDAIDGHRPTLIVNGTDYDTPDGPCIRDNVHVFDLVDAYLLDLEWLRDGRPIRVFKPGAGCGFSVREMIEASRAIKNREMLAGDGPCRAGDVTKLVSGSTRAETELGWVPRRSTLQNMISDAWKWHKTGGHTT